MNHKKTEDGWEAIKNFLFELKPAEVNWARITSCMQKTGESVVEFEERFRHIWTEHSGLNTSEDLDKDTGIPLKTAFVNGLNPEISKDLKIRYDDWDSTVTTFIQIVEWSAKLERAQDVRLRSLQSESLFYKNRRIEDEQKECEYMGYSKLRTKGRCRNCNEEGHWARECRLSLKHQSKNDDHLFKQFQQLTIQQKQTLLNAVQPQGN